MDRDDPPRWRVDRHDVAIRQTQEVTPQPLIEIGQTAWRTADAERVAFIIDARDYFSAFVDAVSRAERSVLILAWDIDSRGAATTFADLEDLTGMSAVPGVTIAAPEGAYGNVVLTNLEVGSVNRHDLTVEAREPRGAIEARLGLPGGGVLTMVATHLGLRRKERRRQTQTLLRICHRARLDPLLVLMGDFNEWWPSARSLRELRRALGPTRAAASFPSSRPVFALDRIWARPLRVGVV
ncbi:MAG: endonuclease/exonuclease/phosphatase family protein [Candidatus Sulfomarinibacteraceae bacterium]